MSHCRPLQLPPLLCSFRSAIVVEPHRQSKEDLLDRFQRAAFGCFLPEVNPENDLAVEPTRKDGRASIASMGFALSSYPVAVERGGMDRRDAAARTLVTLRLRPTFCSPQLQERQAWCKN